MKHQIKAVDRLLGDQHLHSERNAAAVRKRVGSRGLSGFVARALAHELEREGVWTLLAELELTLGPASKADLARARKAWPKR